VPPRDWRLRFKDIEQSIDRIATYIKGLDFEAFSGDRKTVDAVIHNIQIIGEAAIALPDSIIDRYPTVPWASIRAMRHILVHGYFTVDLEIVWSTAKHRLPELRRALRRPARKSRRRPKK
jgi:uncharacterized protein with HEPN domain